MHRLGKSGNVANALIIVQPPLSFKSSAFFTDVSCPGYYRSGSPEGDLRVPPNLGSCNGPGLFIRGREPSRGTQKSVFRRKIRALKTIKQSDNFFVFSHG